MDFGFIGDFVGLDLAHLVRWDVINVEDAVEVVYLVLEDARPPAFGFDADLFAFGVAAFDGDSGMAGHVVADEAGNAEAAFGAVFQLFAALEDLGIDEGDVLVFVFGDEHADGLADLGGGKADTGGEAHGFPHVVDEAFEVGVEARDFLGFGSQDGLVHRENCANRHGMTPMLFRRVLLSCITIVRAGRVRRAAASFLVSGAHRAS